MSSQNNTRLLPTSFTPQPKTSIKRNNTINNNNNNNNNKNKNKNNNASEFTPQSKPSAKRAEFTEPSKYSTPFTHSTPSKRKASTTRKTTTIPTPKPNRKNQSTKPTGAAGIVYNRIERGATEPFVIVYKAEYRDNPPSQAYYVTNKNSHKIYAVTIQQVPECTCPDFLRGYTCKHIYFVLMKVLHVHRDSPILMKANVILMDDLKEMFTFDPIDDVLLASAAIREKFISLFHTDFSNLRGSERKPIGGNCPLCNRLMLSVNDAIWCKMCGENIHRECFEPLIQTKRQQGKGVNCIKCNRLWESTPAYYLKISSTFNRPPKGFVEHSWSHLVQKEDCWILDDGGFDGVTVGLDDCGYLMLFENGPSSIPITRAQPIHPVADQTSSARDNIYSKNWNEDTESESENESTESDTSTEIEDDDTEVDEEGTENDNENMDNTNYQTQTLQTQTTQSFQSQTYQSTQTQPQPYQSTQTQNFPPQFKRETTQSNQTQQTMTTATYSLPKRETNLNPTLLPLKREYIELDADIETQERPQSKSNIALLKTEIKGEPFILAKIETSQLPQIIPNSLKQESQLFANNMKKEEQTILVTPKNDSIQVQYATPQRELITLTFPKNEMVQFQPVSKKKRPEIVKTEKSNPKENEIIILE